MNKWDDLPEEVRKAAADRIGRAFRYGCGVFVLLVAIGGAAVVVALWKWALT